MIIPPEMLYFADANRSGMRKLTMLALLAFFLFNAGGYFLWFRISQQMNYAEVRKEIRAGLHERDLDIIRVSLSGLNEIAWIRDNKEFLYRGDLYDVVKSQAGHDEIIYFCLKDTREKELITRFNKRAHEDQQRSRLLKKIPPLVFIYQLTSIQSLTLPSWTLIIFCQSNYHSPELESHSPPPNQTLS